MLAAKAAHRYQVHITDIDKNGIIDINDIGPRAIAYGMYWIDTAPRDGQLSYAEIKSLYLKEVPFGLRVAAWMLSLFTSKYTVERVFEDCDVNKDNIITLAEYEQRRYTTCMEWCGKAEDIFDYLGIKFGAIP